MYCLVLAASGNPKFQAVYPLFWGFADFLAFRMGIRLSKGLEGDLIICFAGLGCDSFIFTALCQKSHGDALGTYAQAENGACH